MSQITEPFGSTNLVIVPSISETTTRSVDSQTKIRAVVADSPVADREKVIEFAPGFKFNDFYNWGIHSVREDGVEKLVLRVGRMLAAMSSRISSLLSVVV